MLKFNKTFQNLIKKILMEENKFLEGHKILFLIKS